MAAEQAGGTLGVAVFRGRSTARCSAASCSQLGMGEPVWLVPPGRRADQRGLVAQVV